MERRRGDRPDWLEVVCLGLERLGCTVAACRACAGEALLVLRGQAQGPGLEVVLSRSGGGPCFARLPGLSVGYRGSTALEAGSSRAMAALVRLLEGLGPRLPPDLDSGLVRWPEGLLPHQQLSFAFPFCTAERSLGPQGPSVSELLVRVTGRCNQACPFCSAPPGRDEPSLRAFDRLLGCLGDLAPGATVTITGGEPTLRSDLPLLVSRALASCRQVKVQTNATLLARDGAVEQLPGSPRLAFFVSLHALDQALYDECTGSRGLLGRCLTGIERLLAAGHRVVVSTVVNARNAPDLVRWVEALADRFQGPAVPAVHFSVVLCPAHRPGAAEWLVDYRELGPRLERAWTRAVEVGLAPEPLLSSTHASIPACCLSPAYRQRRGAPFALEPQVHDQADPARGWVRSERCLRCLYSPSCPGVPGAYAARFGLACLAPVEPQGPSV